MPFIDTAALVLKSADSGESSRRLTFFSGEEGRFSLVVRGMKTSGKSTGGGLEPYTLARIYANLKPDADLGTLSRAETIERFPVLRDDLRRMAAAAVLCEIIDRGAHPRLANPRLFQYGAAFLRALDQSADDKVVFLLVHAMIRAAQALGVAPRADRCVCCGRPVEASGLHRAHRLNFEAGGAECVSCQSQIAAPARGLSIDAELVALIGACSQRPWAQVSSALSDGPETCQLVNALGEWLTWQLGFPIKSIRFLRSVEGMMEVE